MTQDEKWNIKYQEVRDFIETNLRNPSKHDPEERYRYGNWLKQSHTGDGSFCATNNSTYKASHKKNRPRCAKFAKKLLRNLVDLEKSIIFAP